LKGPELVGSVGEDRIKTTVRLAKLGAGISPHTLRHTAATWLMQRGADPWQVAGYLGMSLDVLLNTYGHHHLDYLSDAVEKIVRREAKTERSQPNTESFLGDNWGGRLATVRAEAITD
jgi:integrase